MPQDAYERLADALDTLPNGFPRTPSRVEIQILKKIISADEASLISQLTGGMEPIRAIAQRLELPVEAATNQLFQMVRRGLVWFEKKDGDLRFRLAPFIVGIYEAQLQLMDHELAHLVEKYLAEGGAAGIMKLQPAVHRVVPAQHSVNAEWILPYDDVRAILLSARVFNVRDCICRVQQEHIGRKCDFPINICLNFSFTERSPWPGDISQQEALALLDKSEEVGLVHTVSNVMEGVGYVCNCCSCCCGILRGITEWGIPNSVAYANYHAVIDAEICAGCGTCIERCQVHAISDQDGVSVVNRAVCIGCGLCVTGCTTQAASLQRKPEAEIIHPPQDFAAWERERLRNRGSNE